MNRAPSIEDNPEINEALGHIHTPRTVDEGFTADLKRIDTLLDTRWNALKSRWEIYRDGLYIMTVRSNDGGYRPLDNRVFQRLFVIDTVRYANSHQFIRGLRLEDEALMGMKRHEQDEFMRACHRDMKPMMRARKSFNANRAKLMQQEKIRERAAKNNGNSSSSFN